MNIFLSNDDGYFSEGILLLAKELSKDHQVTIVAPNKPQSAAGHALTMHKPLRVKYYPDLSEQYGAEVYSCSGKPADCVTIGIIEIMKERPDLVISGINNGANLATDIVYSGTVSAAMEAAMMGYKSIAASINEFNPKHMDTAVQVIAKVVKQYPIDQMDNNFVLNVNVPDIPGEKIKGIRVAPQGKIVYNDIVTKGNDPFGNDFYWIGGTKPTISEPGCDADMVKQGYVTVTPLTFMMTDLDKMDRVKSIFDEIE